MAGVFQSEQIVIPCRPSWLMPAMFSFALHGLVLAALLAAPERQPKRTEKPLSFVSVSMMSMPKATKPEVKKENPPSSSAIPATATARSPVKALKIPEAVPLPTQVSPPRNVAAATVNADAGAEISPLKNTHTVQAPENKQQIHVEQKKTDTEPTVQRNIARKERLERALAEQKKQQQIDWLSMFPSLVAATIQAELPDEMSALGMQCELKIQLTADGTLIDVSDASGDDTLCVAAKNVLFRIGRFDIPGHIPDSAESLKDLTISIR